jgi:prepilin-type N-terminal cleavage/methylation domain-containing protein
MINPRQTLAAKQRGFTLIEVLVAISVLLLGIVGPLALANASLQAGLLSRDQITAYYLAQEAIEMVREVRDENFIERRMRVVQEQPPEPDWLFGLDACIAAGVGDGCRVDGRMNATNRFLHCTDCAQGENSRLFVNEATGEYGHAGTTPSRFSRHVRIEQVDTTRVIVHAYVSFDTEFGGPHTYHVTDHLKNWSPF